MEVLDRMDPRPGRMVYLVHFMMMCPYSVFPNSKRLEEGLVNNTADFIDEKRFEDRYYSYPPFIGMVEIDKWLRNKYGSPEEAVKNIDKAILKGWSKEQQRWRDPIEKFAIPLFEVLSPIYKELMERGDFDSWEVFEVPVNPKY